MEFKNQRELRNYIRESIKHKPNTTITQAFNKALKRKKLVDKIGDRLAR